MSFKKRLLTCCVLFSVFLHALFLFMVQQHSLWFTASAHSLHYAAKIPPKTEILKESFAHFSPKGTVQKLEPKKIHQQVALSLPFAKTDIDVADLIACQLSFDFHPSELLAYQHVAPVLKTPQNVHLQLDLSNVIIPPSTTPTPKPPRPSAPPKHPESPPSFKSQLPALKSAEPPMIAYSTQDFDIADLRDTSAPRRALLTIPTPPLPSFPSLDELDTSTYSDYFDLDIVCLPKNNQPGFLFALTLIPRSDLHLPKLHQHFHFLIDRANSIQRERLLATKGAVMKAIEDLASDDTFNVIVFDSKVEKLFSSPRPPDQTSLKLAINFLDKINLGSFFAPADLYNPLLLTIPQQIQDDEIHTAILITDGETLAKKTAMRSLLQTWTWQNGHKVSLYCLGMGGDSQLATLDVACAFNQGRLYYSPTKRGIKRKLLKLMKNIEMPVAKSMTCRCIAPTQNRIDVFPRSNASHLFLNQPFVIIGSCERLDDFILFVQGRLKDRWMNVKKTISFVNAKRGDHSLKQEWALQQAYQCYERYVLDDNPEHLAHARALLEPFDLETAFQ